MSRLEIELPDKIASTIFTPSRYKVYYGGRGGAKSCGSHHDRDKNAAINIEREGLRLIAHQAGHRLEGEAA